MTASRLVLMIGVTLGLLAAPLAADAQPAKPARIGLLVGTVSTPGNLEAFRDGLRELGHIEGQTYTIELRETGGKHERSSELAADLVRSRVDLLLTNALQAEVAKTVSATIPVIFIATNPVAEGFVASFSRPGGNLTGFALPWEDLASKWAELLRDAFPRIRRVAYLGVPGTGGFRAQFPRFKAAAAALKLDVLPLEVRGEGDLEAAFAAAARQRAEAITQQAATLFDAQRPRLLALAARYRLPALYFRRSFVDAGGLMSYGPDLRYVWRRAAVYADRILKGAKPADLPVEQPTRYELVVNLRTARALGLTIPQSILVRADEVIE